MAAAEVATHNPPQPTESKSARKKKAKAADTTSATTKERRGSQASISVSGVKTNGSDAGGAYESAHVKELQK
jgi:hypothetical protein